MAGKQGVVTTAQLAAFFGLTRERVGQLTAEGMPKLAHGQYDFVLATRWYIRFLQESNKRRTTPGGHGGADAFRREKVESLVLDTEIKRLALMKARGELVPVAEVNRMFDTAVGTLKAKMMAAVSRAGARLMAAKSQKEATVVVEEVVIEALGAMQKVGVEWKDQHVVRNGTPR